MNPAGQMVQTVWEELPRRFPDIELDEFIIMPNHVHGIIVIVGAPLVGARGSGADGDKNRAGTRPAPTNARQQNTTAATPKPLLGEIVGAFKSITTHEYVNGITQDNWPPFPGRLWQRNYYEHIIRDEDSLNKIREYIIQNPLRWGYDPENTIGKPDGLERDFWRIFGQNQK
ncbi:MAG: transposase [candidate division Zixibacteria bacterium]|nr:transposase [candidate division Zixibacteria bacterium]